MKNIIKEAIYNKAELCDLLEIKENYFRNHRKECLDYLKSHCNLEEFPDPTDKRKALFFVKELYTENGKIEPLQSGKKLQEKKEKVLTKHITKELKRAKLNSASNISDRMKGARDIEQFHWADGTRYNNTLKLMNDKLIGTLTYDPDPKDRIGKIVKKVWCKKDGTRYEEMSKEDTQLFFEIRKKYKPEKDDEDEKAYWAFKHGEISKEQVGEQLLKSMDNYYKKALDEFFMRKGYYPVYVNLYELF